MKLNRTLVLCLSIVLAASMALGGTLAFLTDTESKVNTFTVGEVDIELKENFPVNKLTPGVKLQKEVTIKNIGENPAYVWFTYALPVIANNDTDASQNVLHTNTRGKYWDIYRENPKYWDEGQVEAELLENTWSVDWCPDENNVNVGPKPIDYVKVPVQDENGSTYEVDYAIYANLYHGVLEPGAETSPGMSTVYLDSRVDLVDGEYCFVENGVATPLVPEADNPVGIDLLNVIVNAYAIQVEGMEDQDVFEAFHRYYGQWGYDAVKTNVVKAYEAELSADDSTDNP